MSDSDSGSMNPDIQLKSSPKIMESSISLKESYLHRRSQQFKLIDFIYRNLTRISALFIPFVLVAIFFALYQGALPSIHKFGWHFLTSSQWDPVADEFGALVPVYGTLITSFIALVISVPVSFGIAIFLTEIAPEWLRRPFGVAIELLAAIPSIIYGMWGLFVFAPFFARTVQPWIQNHTEGVAFLNTFFQGPSIGIGVLTAGIILAVMIIPFISSTMRDSFQVVPTLLKESAYGLGATKWEVIWNVVFPYSRQGVAGGIILGLARALGETMAVTFVIGNAHSLSPSLFMPGSTISSILANEFTEAVGDLHPAALIELGLILFVLTFVFLMGARLLLMSNQKKAGSL